MALAASEQRRGAACLRPIPSAWYRIVNGDACHRTICAGAVPVGGKKFRGIHFGGHRRRIREALARLAAAVGKCDVTAKSVKSSMLMLAAVIPSSVVMAWRRRRRHRQRYAGQAKSRRQRINRRRAAE